MKLLLRTGHELHYSLIPGDESRPVLVFLHEALGCEAMWKRFPQKLCQASGHPGLVYDRRGSGQSSPLQGERTIHFLHEYALHELPAVLNAAIPGKPYILIGHSDGASIGLLHGAEQPGLLHGIVSEAAHVFVEEETLQGIEHAVIAWDAGRLDGLHRYHGAKTAALFRAWADVWRSPGFRHWNIEYCLPSITVPMLVLQGAQDQYGSPAQVDSITRHAGGKARKEIIPDCRHIPHLEAQPQVLDLICEFISVCEYARAVPHR